MDKQTKIGKEEKQKYIIQQIEFAHNILTRIVG